MTPQNFITLPRKLVEQAIAAHEYLEFLLHTALEQVPGQSITTIGRSVDKTKVLEQLRAAFTEQVQPAQCNYPDCKCPTETPCLKGLVQPAQGERAELIAALWMYSREGIQTDLARQCQREAAALLQSNAERLPLSFAKVNEIFDAHKDAPEHSRRYLIANAIEAAHGITKGQQ